MRNLKKYLTAGALAGVMALSAFPMASQAEIMPHHIHDYRETVVWQGCEYFDANCHTCYEYKCDQCTRCGDEKNINGYTYLEEHSYEWVGDRFECDCGDFYR